MSIPMMDDYKFQPQGDSPVDLSGREGAPIEPDCDIRAFWSKREWAGGCNGCERRDGARVAEIQLNAITIRLCDNCADALAEILVKLITE